ncbi:MAG TPA: hypothetical protein VEB21_10775 [Terriglobales bacterium]|nr:hypothetical protein [Terriglobales bacterium]
MSEYFRVLNRLAEQGGVRPSANAPRPLSVVPRPATAQQSVPVVPSEAPAPAPVDPAVEGPTASEARSPQAEPARASLAQVPAPVAAAVAEPAAAVLAAPLGLASTTRAIPSALQELVDVVERIRHNGATKSLVLTSASGHEHAAELAARVVRIMNERGLPIAAVRIPDGNRFRASVELGELVLTEHSGDWAAQLHMWRTALPAGTVAMVVAPTLATTSDAALLGQACDGVIILVELGRTTRRALAQAVKRIEGASATLLGLIVVGSEGLPSWARRIRRSLQ